MVYFSQWLPIEFPSLYSDIITALGQYSVEYRLLPNTEDYWCRDYMPIQLNNGRFLRYKYFPDYLNTKRNRPYITDPKMVCDALGIETIVTDIILDGGNVVRCGGKVVMTDKIFYENQNYSKTNLVNTLEKLLEAEVVLVPWDRAEKLGHADGIVRSLGGSKVLMTNYLQIAPKEGQLILEALERHFEVVQLSYPTKHLDDRSWVYINFLQTDSVILLPKLGIPEDDIALSQIEQQLPSYCGKIVQIDVSELIKNGGALNCISWEK